MLLSISRKIVDSLPEDPFKAILAIISEFRQAMAIVTESPGDEAFRARKRYQIAQEVCTLLSVYLKREGFAITTPQLTIAYDKLANTEREREKMLSPESSTS